MNNAITDVLAERQRQKDVEGQNEQHDDDYANSELSRAAACYAYPEIMSLAGDKIWPWHLCWWKPKSDRENLVRAAALLIAEIERIDRKS